MDGMRFVIPSFKPVTVYKAAKVRGCVVNANTWTVRKEFMKREMNDYAVVRRIFMRKEEQLRERNRRALAAASACPTVPANIFWRAARALSRVVQYKHLSPALVQRRHPYYG